LNKGVEGRVKVARGEGVEGRVKE